MDASEFPDEFNLRFRNHVLYVHLKSTLEFADAIATEGPDNLNPDDLKLFDELVAQLESAWVESAKIKKRAYGQI